MPKMTTEQFLSHLGIEVGKVYKAGGVEFKVCSLPVWSLLYENENGIVVSTNNFSWLLNREITPLPKYTLTDDEKAIVRGIDQRYSFIARDNYEKGGKNQLCVMSHKPTKAFDYWRICQKELDNSNKPHSHVVFPFPELFQFIRWEDVEPVSLDELRKCL